MEKGTVIERTKDFVKQALQGAEGGHDWFHVERVHRMAKRLLAEERADALVVELSALLHDVADPKFHNGDETVGPRMAQGFLETQGVDPRTVAQVVEIVGTMAYKNSFDTPKKRATPELKIVQDADRLDAMGAIGIARAFSYGGFSNRALYDPEIPPNLAMDKETYKNSTAPTINHFYEKLLLLEQGMHTPTGKKLAAQRHGFMLEFLARFLDEWAGK